MKIAIVGSRSIVFPEIERYIPSGVTEIVSGGADGVDMAAGEYAIRRKLKLVEFIPKYAEYGRRAPIVRNKEIAEYADLALVFWDGESRGTKNVIDFFRRFGKRVIIILNGEKIEP